MDVCRLNEELCEELTYMRKSAFQITTHFSNNNKKKTISDISHILIACSSSHQSQSSHDGFNRQNIINQPNQFRKRHQLLSYFS